MPGRHPGLHPTRLKQSFCIGFTGEVFSFRAALSFVQKRITKAYRTYIPTYLHPSVLTDVRDMQTHQHTYVEYSAFGAWCPVRAQPFTHTVYRCIHVLALSSTPWARKSGVLDFRVSVCLGRMPELFECSCASLASRLCF